MKRRPRSETHHPYIALVRTLPCSVGRFGHQTTTTEPDHVPTIGSYGSWHTWVWPLCHEHHAERHLIGLLAFQKKYSISAQETIDFLREWYERLSSPQIATITRLRLPFVTKHRALERAAA